MNTPERTLRVYIRDIAVNIEEVWAVIEKDLPELKPKIQALLSSME